MITRAQAEALLTLAESLEACERLSLETYVSLPREWIDYYDPNMKTAIELRAILSDLIPKQET